MSAVKFLSQTGKRDYVKDEDLSLTDITTNNVTTSQHGFVPKAPNDASKFFRGDATWDYVIAGDFNWIIKASDESRASDTTLTIDDDLVFTADANTMYEIELKILTHCNGGSGMLAYKIELPSILSGVDRYMVTGNYNNANTLSYAAPAADDSNFGYVYVTLYASQPATVHLRVNVTTGSSGGTIGFKWSQATSDATLTVIMKGSSLKYRIL